MRERKRTSARVLLRSERGEVLLIRFEVLRSGEPWVFWAAPGGEVEQAESPADAAAREVREELGLEIAVEGPVRVEQNRFEHWGEMMDNTDHFFTTQILRSGPRLSGVTEAERSIMKEVHWWTAAEIEASGETIFPVWLAEWMRSQQTGADAVKRSSAS